MTKQIYPPKAPTFIAIAPTLRIKGSVSLVWNRLYYVLVTCHVPFPPLQARNLTSTASLIDKIHTKSQCRHPRRATSCLSSTPFAIQTPSPKHRTTATALVVSTAPLPPSLLQPNPSNPCASSSAAQTNSATTRYARSSSCSNADRN